MNNTINNAFINSINAKTERSFSAIYELNGQFYRTPAYSYNVLILYVDELRRNEHIENVKFIANPY